MCRAGTAWGRYDSQDFTLTRNSFAIITSYHWFESVKYSPDYEAIVVIMSNELAHRMWMAWAPSFHLLFSRYPIVQVSDNESRVMWQALLLLQSVVQQQCAIAESLCDQIIGIILQLYRSIDGATRQHDFSPLQVQLFERFYHLVMERHRQSRKVEDYARCLCITPKHLSTTVKLLTGSSAGEWISHSVISDAKTLLRSKQGEHIQSVAHTLGFPDTASFNKYFKRHTHMTPGKWRALR